MMLVEVLSPCMPARLTETLTGNVTVCAVLATVTVRLQVPVRPAAGRLVKANCTEPFVVTLNVGPRL